MIQRKQTLWLLIASLVNLVLFFVSFYKAAAPSDLTDANGYISAPNRLTLMLTAGIIVIVPLIAIFLYKNRKQQRKIVILCIIAALSYVSLMWMIAHSADKQVATPANGTWQAGALIPFVSIVFLILAVIGINKDEKLIKSMDRLR